MGLRFQPTLQRRLGLRFCVQQQPHFRGATAAAPPGGCVLCPAAPPGGCVVRATSGAASSPTGPAFSASSPSGGCVNCISRQQHDSPPPPKGRCSQPAAPPGGCVICTSSPSCTFSPPAPIRLEFSASRPQRSSFQPAAPPGGCVTCTSSQHISPIQHVQHIFQRTLPSSFYGFLQASTSAHIQQAFLSSKAAASTHLQHAQHSAFVSTWQQVAEYPSVPPQIRLHPSTICISPSINSSSALSAFRICQHLATVSRVPISTSAHQITPVYHLHFSLHPLPVAYSYMPLPPLHSSRTGRAPVFTARL
ncbi:hypothetical protein L7F22_051991 [Adiantum nelumboides]|nr:hypothetical protein [Adiantum nelumboides]